MLKYQFFWNNSCQPPFNITRYFTMLHIRKYISLSILQYYILKSLGSSNHVKPRPTHNDWSNSGWHPMTAVCKSSQGFSLAAQVQNLRKNFFYRTEEAPASPSADEQPSARVDRTCCALWVCPQQGTVGRVHRKQRGCRIWGEGQITRSEGFRNLVLTCVQFISTLPFWKEFTKRIKNVQGKGRSCCYVKTNY